MPVKKKSVKKKVAQKKSSNKAVSLATISTQLNSISKRLTKIESQIMQEDKLIESEEQAELAELQKLEKLEKQLEKEVHVSPLKKITLRDFSKSVIGASFGVLGHFAFYKGVDIGAHISVTRASLLYIVAFFIGFLFLYYAGFRNVKRATTLQFLPIRLFVIYGTSIMTIILVLFLFDFAGSSYTFIDLYKTVASTSILAVMGAAAADLIGKEQE